MTRVSPPATRLPRTVFGAGPAAAVYVNGGTGATHDLAVGSRTGDARIGDAPEPGAERGLADAEAAVLTVVASEPGVPGRPRLSGPAAWDGHLHALPTDSCRRASPGE